MLFARLPAIAFVIWIFLELLIIIFYNILKIFLFFRYYLNLALHLLLQILCCFHYMYNLFRLFLFVLFHLLVVFRCYLLLCCLFCCNNYYCNYYYNCYYFLFRFISCKMDVESKTWFNENYFRRYFYHASCFTTNSYGIFLTNDLWG